MADTLYISKAGSLSWNYNTGTGAIHNTSQNLDANFLYADADDYYNCDLDNDKRDAQTYNCDDTASVQFEYSRSGADPLAVVYDKDGSAIQVIPSASMLNESTLYGFTLDFSDTEFTCGECHSVKLWSRTAALPANNLFTDGQNGTMENPGGITNMATSAGNTAVQSLVQAQAGIASMAVTAGLVPVNADRLIAYGTTNLNLTSGNIYIATAYVWVDSGVSFINGNDIYIDIAGTEGLAGPNYFADATILSETRYNFGSDGTDNWVRIDTTFQVNADTSGNIPVVSVKIPTASGLVYVDTISVRLITNHLEATSEPIYLEANHPCTTLIKYGALAGREHEQFGLFYTDDNTNDFYGFLNTIRIRIKAFQFNMVDDDYTTEDDSVGTAGVVVSRIVKQYVCHTDLLPVYMLEKLAFAMKHDSVRFYNASDGKYVEMICLTKTFNPVYPNPKSLYGTIEFIMRPREYDYSNSNCS